MRETVPDSFLKQADQVVNLDLARRGSARAAEGRQDLPADKVPWALEHFFRQENLSTLRELALREVAESLERAARRAAVAGRRARAADAAAA